MIRPALRAALLRAILAIRKSAALRWVLTCEGRRELRAAYQRGLRGEKLPLHQQLCYPIVLAHVKGREAALLDPCRGRGALRVFRDLFCNHRLPRLT